ncbi:ribosome biogenesis GTPase Der [Insolitispirillum peregrinum]|uniref:ribosome biogenesis GTPase Der n=1 Tax=Insolitispirillum peregrinum TaxID=80876 RepID=UPI0036225C1E
MSFTVAIIGRPNVGKSTLFNRLIGRKLAIVHDMPGVTRDRRSAPASLLGLEFEVIDTAGLEVSGPETLEGRMRQQTERALAEADVALFLIDGRAGLTPMDEHFAQLLRRQKTPVILVANKCEGKAGDQGMYESYGLGLGDPIPLSAEHGLGLGDLLAALLPYSKELPYDEDDEFGFAPEPEEIPDIDEGDEVVIPPPPDRPLHVAIVGRPNTGKSTLVNCLLGEDRMLTGPEAGVTRDSITVKYEWRGRPIKIVDTAGIRRRSRVEESLEKLSVADTLNSIRMAEVVVLMLDANMVLDKQDLTIARLVLEEGRALVIAVNKWDAAIDRAESLQRLGDRLQTSLPQVRGIPTVTLSALRNQGVDDLMEAVFEIHSLWNARVPTSRLNRWLDEMITRHPPPLSKQKRRIKLRYMTQVKARPPTFAIFVSKPDELPESYMRYLVNGLRDVFGLDGVPLRIHLRKPKNPYVD